MKKKQKCFILYVLGMGKVKIKKKNNEHIVCENTIHICAYDIFAYTYYKYNLIWNERNEKFFDKDT